jgi:hypothetical protein
MPRQMSSLGLPRPSCRKRTSPCLRCVDVPGGSGGGGKIGAVTRVSYVLQHFCRRRRVCWGTVLENSAVERAGRGAERLLAVVVKCIEFELMLGALEL